MNYFYFATLIQILKMIGQNNLINLFDKDFDSTVNELFESHYVLLCRKAYRIVNNKDIAEDLVQDVFFKLWENRKKIVIKTSLKAYLNRMVFNESISFLRKNKTVLEFSDEIEHQETVNETESKLGATELKDIINAAIEELPPKCKTIFLLSRMEELSYKQIAMQLGISIKTVENQMGKALKLLRGTLKHYYFLYLFYFSDKI